MGNCTSKKSLKLSKITLSTLPPGIKMEKNHMTKNDSRGLSKKIVPSSKGEATSFGFKRHPAPSLPTPVTLTSRVAEMRQDTNCDSSVESLCHVTNSSPLVTPSKAAPSRRTVSPGMGAANRFGFRSATPPRTPGSRGLPATPRTSPAGRSKSAVGAREARAAFFKDVMHTAGSANSIVGSQTDVANPGKFWLQTSQLPRAQYPIRLQDKAYKTVTNYSRRAAPTGSCSSKENSITEDSGIASHNVQQLSDTDTLHGLSDSSPPQTRIRARKLEMRMVGDNRFELLDKSRISRPTPFIKAPRTTPSTGLVQQRTQQYLERIAGNKNSSQGSSSGASHGISPSDSIESEEEKVKKDSRRSEKSMVCSFLMNEGSGENDEFLPGEAMADDITLSFSSDDDLSESKEINTKKDVVRSDALLVSSHLRGQPDSSNTQLLGVERGVLDEHTLLELSSESESPDKDCGDEKTSAPLNVTLNTSTESPGTPSNGSMSEGRDFLIDDEIADQPQLCFSTHEDLNMDKIINLNSEGGTNDNAPGEVAVRRVSVGTLSPCESITSEDLIMDFDNNSDENFDRCAGSLEGLGEESCSQDERDSLPRRKLVRTNGHLPIGGSAGGSPASQRSGVSRTSTDEELSVRLDKTTCQHMFQDIVSIKSMLLKLNSVLSECDGNAGHNTEEESVMDLKKQVMFLQQQLQKRENSLQALQDEVNRAVDRRPAAPVLCNAATQTEKTRPVSTSASILNLPADSNVLTNGSNRKVAEWIEDNNRQTLVKIAPADKILEKVKELSFKPVDVIERGQCREVCGKNVFKITKIDLVLKSDNYGQNELRKS